MRATAPARRLPLADVGTDRDRIDTWSKDGGGRRQQGRRRHGHRAQGARRREPLIGYNAAFLDGIWLRAPYLHNGRCRRSATCSSRSRGDQNFYRGYDVYDQFEVGFVTSPDEAELVGMRCEAVQAKKLCEVERVGTAYDVNQRGSGNQGHVYGTDLATKDKEALVEYLKTL